MPTQTRPKSPKARNADSDQVLQRLERMIERSDSFTLGFVKCNHPLQQKEMRREFLARLSDKRVLEVELDKPLVSLLDVLTTRWDSNNPPDVVCVYGLEKSVTELCEASPVLGRLNHDRELIRRAVPVPLLIWLPDFALDLMARGAPDFWAWRSGVYEFATEKALWERDTIPFLAPAPSVLASLTLQQKQYEIIRIKESLRIAYSLPTQNTREQKIVAGLLYQLGVLYDSISEWKLAKDCFEQSLRISNKLADKSAIAITLHYLGIVQQHLGNSAVAKDLYEQSLSMEADWVDPRSLVSPYHQIGKIAYEAGNLKEAEVFFRKSLKIAKESDNLVGEAMSLHHLGMIAHDQGDWEQATTLYQESLRLAKKTNTDDVIVNTVHQQGLLEQNRGNYSEALRLYKQSLEMSEQLGDKYSNAISSYQIGNLYLQMGQIASALQYYLPAWDRFIELGVPESAWVKEVLIQIKQQVGDLQFNAWLAEDFGKQAREIRERLDKSIASSSDE